MEISILHGSGQITTVPAREDESVIQDAADELPGTIFFYAEEVNEDVKT